MKTSHKSDELQNFKKKRGGVHKSGTYAWNMPILYSDRLYFMAVDRVVTETKSAFERRYASDVDRIIFVTRAVE